MREPKCAGTCDCIRCEKVPITKTSPEDHQRLVEGRHRVLGDPQSTLGEETEEI